MNKINLVIILFLSLSAFAGKDDPPNHIVAQTGGTSPASSTQALNAAYSMATQRKPEQDLSAIQAQSASSQAQLERLGRENQSYQDFLNKHQAESAQREKVLKELAKSSQAPLEDRIARASQQWLEKKLTTFRSNHEDLKQLYKDIYQVSPPSQPRKVARQLGLGAVEEADASYAENQMEDGAYYQHMAQGFLDIAIGLDPISGLARSTYELFTCKNLITGAPLSQVEHAFAFVGVMTAGGGRTVLKATQLTTKMMNRVFAGAAKLLESRTIVEKAMQEGGILGSKIEHLVQGWKKNHIITGIKTAEEANAPFVAKGLETPYETGTHVVVFRTLKESQWVRVHTPDTQTGSWLARKSEIQGLTPKKIQLKFSIPKTPTHISDVHVPAGTSMSRGNVQFHDFENLGIQGPSGAIQYRIEGEIEGFTNWFKNAKPLPEVLHE